MVYGDPPQKFSEEKRRDNLRLERQTVYRTKSEYVDIQRF